MNIMRKRLFILSVLLITVCGQMWAGRSGTKGEEGIYSGIRFTLYSNYSYYYDDSYYSCNLGDVAVITSFDDNQMIIPETLGGCSQIVIGSGALTSSVRDLQISKSVKLLEFNAVYNATNIESLTIADGTTLVCFGAGTPEQSMQNGSFSYIKKLQSVYLGGNLEYDDYSTKYNAPFYNLNTEQAFSLTIGPNVTSIPERCFGNCDDIKSIKAMPQTPPTLYYNALGNTSATVPVYVSYKTKSAYTSASGWSTFTNYVLDTGLCKADALNDLDAEAGQNPSSAVQGIVSDYKGLIDLASSCDDVVANLNAGIAAIQLQKAKEDAIATLNAEAGTSPSQAVAGVRDTWIANVNNAGTITDVNTQKTNGIVAIQLQKSKDDAIAALNDATTTYPSDAVDEIVSTYTGKINAATTTTDVTKEKEAGIQALQDAYNAQIALQNAKEAAISALNAAKTTYPSDAADGIVSAYNGKIYAATTTTDVTKEKNEGIQALQDAYNAQIALQNAKEAAISALNDAKTTYPSDAVDEIVSTYTGKINAATTTTDVTKEKNEGIQALQDAYNAQKEAERLATLDAMTVTQTADDDFSYLLEDNVAFIFDGDDVKMTVDGADETEFILSETVAITVCPARTFSLTAKQDPDNTGNYYSTFFTSEGAYKIPEGVKAYIGKVEKTDDPDSDVLNLTALAGGVIHKKEGVVLKADNDDILLMPSCNKGNASSENKLTGADEDIPTPETGTYGLTYDYRTGVGFYKWTNPIPANKAFLVLEDGGSIKALRFNFDDEQNDADGIRNIRKDRDGKAFNLQGVKVGRDYKGMVIKNGRKEIRR